MLNMQDRKGNTVVEVFDDRYDKQVRYVSTHLRAADFDETFASTGESPHLDVIESWEQSSKRFIIFDRKARAVAVLGVRPLEAFSRTGIVWLLGTDGLGKIKRFFLKISKPIIKELLIGYDELINYVDARYTKAVRWLKWCGFEVEEDHPFGAFDKPFHKIIMRCQ